MALNDWSGMCLIQGIKQGDHQMKLSKSIAGIALAFAFTGYAQATTLLYNDFSSTAGLQINGNAAQAGTALRVTPANYSQSGSFFSTNTVSLASNASFSTAFRFQFSGAGGACDGQGCGADGLFLSSRQTPIALAASVAALAMPGYQIVLVLNLTPGITALATTTAATMSALI